MEFPHEFKFLHPNVFPPFVIHMSDMAPTDPRVSVYATPANVWMDGHCMQGYLMSFTDKVRNAKNQRRVTARAISINPQGTG